MEAVGGAAAGRGSDSDGDKSTRDKNKDLKHYLSPDQVPSMIEKSTSLQRLQNQSSTETSGLGETVTSGLSSQESIASLRSCASDRDQGIDLSESPRPHRRHESYITNEIEKACIIDGTLVDNSNQPMIEAISATRGTDESTHETKLLRNTSDTDIFDENLLTVQAASKGAGEYGSPDFDELFLHSENFPVSQNNMGLQLEQINAEWGSHSRAGSTKSRSSVGSFRSRSGSNRGSRKFLGRNMDSAWTKWSKERRASYRRRLELLGKPDPDVPERASTPVRKARQEGLKFVHPDLESKYISEEDINYIQRHRQQRLQTYKVIEKSNKKTRFPTQPDIHHMRRLTVHELSVLSRFWEHRIFIRSRYVSILFSIVTTILLITSICSSQWIKYPSEGENKHDMRKFGEEFYLREAKLWRPFRWFGILSTLTAMALMVAAILNEDWIHSTSKLSNVLQSGIWAYCYRNQSSDSSCSDKYPTWQNAVIGLMIFSASFGFIATILAICGVCTSPLPKKIYYFHSSGEIFFVCALCSTVALIIYPVALSMDDNIHSFTYGSGYGLGWGGTAFFFAASLCMSLDDLVRESSQNKFCRMICWRSSSTDGNELQQV